MKGDGNMIVSAILLLCGVLSVDGSAAHGQASAPADESRVLRVLFVDAQGKPVPQAQIRELHCRSMEDEPLVAEIPLADGRARVFLPGRPAQLSALIEVAGFGDITVYADGRGRGYSQAGTIDFIKEAAATRLLRVRELLRTAQKEGLRLPGFAEKLAQAERLNAHQSLARTLAAGEELTLALARHRITRLKGPRKGFLIGGNVFGHPARGPEYDRRFRELYNYGTMNLYLSRYAPEPDRRDYARPDSELAWLQSMGMAAKPCPPLYFAGGVTPAWLKEKPWDQVRPICHHLMLEVARRYAGKVVGHEIVNEAHDYSNSLRLSPEQLNELAAISSKACREGDPKALRIINSCHLWGEYASRPTKDGKLRRSPLQYLKDCMAAGVEFEVVGLQMYYPEYDLLEIDRMLERYAKLGKTIHITEMGCQSAPGIDPNAQRKKATAGWHGPWTEQMQADWVEGVYTLFYSKPYITAVSWWDLADAVSFWPYGGLLRGDCSPKPAYERLLGLVKAWGLKPAGG